MPNKQFRNPDMQEAFEERAGILEFDAGYNRESAEEMAEIMVRKEWEVRIARMNDERQRGKNAND